MRGIYPHHSLCSPPPPPHHLLWRIRTIKLDLRGSWTTPHQDNSPPGKIKPNHCPPGPWSLGQLPTRTTPLQDHYQLVKPLIRTNTCMVGNCPGGELSGYGFKDILHNSTRTPPPPHTHTCWIPRPHNYYLALSLPPPPPPLATQHILTGSQTHHLLPWSL